MGIIFLWAMGAESSCMFLCGGPWSPCGNASSQCVPKSHIDVTLATCQCFVSVGVINVQTHQVCFGVNTNFHISNSTLAPLHSKLLYPK